MAPRIVFVPMAALSPAACERLPATGRLLEELRASFDVEVMTLPWMKPAAADVDAVKAITGRLDGDCGVLGTDVGSALTLHALAGGGRARAMAMAGFMFPPGWRTEGVHVPESAMAEAFPVWLRSARPFEVLRAHMVGASEEVVRAAAHAVEEEVDWEAFARYRELPGRVLSAPLGLDLPVIYLHSPLDLPRTRAVVRELVPTAETGELESWPVKSHEAEAGRELAAAVTPFFNRTLARE
jgi:hypothetical protein